MIADPFLILLRSESQGTESESLYEQMSVSIFFLMWINDKYDSDDSNFFNHNKSF
jgi:hypothetical protein